MSNQIEMQSLSLITLYNKLVVVIFKGTTIVKKNSVISLHIASK